MGYAARFIQSTGERCIIDREPPVETKISKRRSTRAIRDYAAREAHWEGLAFLSTGLQSGEMLIINGTKYLVQSTNLDPASGETFWHAVKTNTVIGHLRSSKNVDDDRNVTYKWEVVDEDVTGIPSFGEIVTAEMRSRDHGILQATRYIFQVAKAHDLRKLDRVVFDGSNYRVDAVNDIGMVGVVRIQVSEDSRA